jgi:glutaredoxin
MYMFLFGLVILFLFSMCSKKPVSGCAEKPDSQSHSQSETHKGEFKVYGYMGCPYTVKQLDLLKTNDISHKFIPTDTSKGAEEFKLLMKGERSGVPVTLNMENGKISKGFTAIAAL